MKKIIFIISLLLPAFINAQSYDVHNFAFNGTIQSAIRIETNIPYTSSSHMPNIRIEGYNYGGQTTIGLNIVWYVYDGEFNNVGASSWGGYTPDVFLSEIDGKVNIFLKTGEMYYGRFKISAYAYGLSEQASWFSGWNVTDEDIDGNNQTSVPYYNKFKDHVEVEGMLSAATIGAGTGLFNAVGIGTNNPAFKLDIGGNSGTHFLNTFRAGYALIGGGSSNDYDFIGYNFSPASSGYKYAVNDYGSAIKFGSGGFQFLTAIPGTTGNQISSSEVMSIYQNGNVGIGRNDPGFKLDVKGPSQTLIRVTSTDPAQYSGFRTSWLDYTSSVLEMVYHPNSAQAYIQTSYAPTSGHVYGDIIFRSDAYGTPRELLRLSNYTRNVTMTVDGGNVGVGTTNPTQKLDVNGNAAVNGKVFIGNVDPGYTGPHLLAVNGSAIFTKVKVKLYGSQWPDYVFSQTYKLRPLSAVEEFVKKNKHLPDVPSVTEIDENGVDVGETQAILLRKIEELTLYVIEQNKINKEQRVIIENLEEKIKKIETLLKNSQK